MKQSIINNLITNGFSSSTDDKKHKFTSHNIVLAKNLDDAIHTNGTTQIVLAKDSDHALHTNGASQIVMLNMTTLERVNYDSTLTKHIIKDDQTWVHQFDMQNRQRALECRFVTGPNKEKTSLKSILKSGRLFS